MKAQKFYHAVGILSVFIMICMSPIGANGDEAQCPSEAQERIVHHLESLKPISDDFSNTLAEYPWMKWNKIKVSNPLSMSLKEARILQRDVERVERDLPKYFRQDCREVDQKVNAVINLIAEELEKYGDDVKSACYKETRSKEIFSTVISEISQKAIRAKIIRELAINELEDFEFLLDSMKNKFQTDALIWDKIVGVNWVLSGADYDDSIDFVSYMTDKNKSIAGEVWLETLKSDHQKFMGYILKKVSEITDELEKEEIIPEVMEPIKKQEIIKIRSRLDKLSLYYPLPEE